MMNDVPLLMNELDRIAHEGIPRTCFCCDYSRRCWRGDGSADCMILKEIEHRLKEWQRFKEAEDDGR